LQSECALRRLLYRACATAERLAAKASRMRQTTAVHMRVVQQTLAVIDRRCATPPARLRAVLGPAIGACCYRLNQRAVGPFQERFSTWEQFFTPHRPERWTMDLLTANALQLCAAGVPATHIAMASLCTACHNQDLYSHRAEGQEAGRGMAVAALRVL